MSTRSLAAAGPLTIRPLHTLKELESCVRLQKEVWGRGFSEMAPVSILKASQRLGGLVGGAMDEDGELVGFVFGLTGLDDGRPAHWSHMLAVRPGLRNGGLGRRLKAWQRDQCRKLAVERMYWSFDPLESRNGWLNLGRLGVVVREYTENMYGESDSPLHRGLGTDRFVALWLLDSQRVDERLGCGEAPVPAWADVCHLPSSFPVSMDDGLPRPGASPAPGPDTGDAVLVPIPADIQRIKGSDPELAVTWRTATRAALAPRLARKWEVRDLVRSTEAVSYYVLHKAEAEDGPLHAPAYSTRQFGKLAT